MIERVPAIRRSAVVAVLAAVAVTVVMLAGIARADRSCSPPKYPGNGYFTSLKVSRTTCATGKSVALAWYKCRIKHGIRGHCHQRVLGFSCKEQRKAEWMTPTEFNALVTCTKKGHRKVVHTYQQNT